MGFVQTVLPWVREGLRWRRAAGSVVAAVSLVVPALYPFASAAEESGQAVGALVGALSEKHPPRSEPGRSATRGTELPQLHGTVVFPREGGGSDEYHMGLTSDGRVEVTGYDDGSQRVHGTGRLTATQADQLRGLIADLEVGRAKEKPGSSVRMKVRVFRPDGDLTYYTSDVVNEIVKLLARAADPDGKGRLQPVRPQAPPSKTPGVTRALDKVG